VDVLLNPFTIPDYLRTEETPSVSEFTELLTEPKLERRTRRRFSAVE
jgi:hypothetical protein